MSFGPEGASPRHDLPWLRRRSLRTVPPVASLTRRETTTGLGIATVREAETPLNLPIRQQGQPQAQTSRQARRSAHSGDFVLAYTPERVSPGSPTTLSTLRPTVALTRVQSGVGTLTVRAACSERVGDLRLAVAYELRSGQSSVLCHARGVHVAPAHERWPLIVGDRDVHETVRVDLRQVTKLERLLVIAFSQSGHELHWGGAVVIETYGGGRVDLALDRPPAAGVLVALSAYNVVGELVLRAEDNFLDRGTLRDAALAYGFERITWVDAWTPLT